MDLSTGAIFDETYVSPRLLQIKELTFHVFQLFHLGHLSPVQCGAVRVEEHAECGCGCPLSAADCNERQVTAGTTVDHRP